MNKLLLVVMLLVTMPVFGQRVPATACDKERGIDYCLKGVDSAKKWRATRKLVTLVFDIWGLEVRDGFSRGSTITFHQADPDSPPVVYHNGKHSDIYLTRLNTMDFMNIIFEMSHEVGHVYLRNQGGPMVEAFCGGLSYLTLKHAEARWKKSPAWVGRDYTGGANNESKAEAGKEYYKKVADYIQASTASLEAGIGLTAADVRKASEGDKDAKMKLASMNHDQAILYGFLLARECKTVWELMEKLGIKQQFPNVPKVDAKKQAEADRQMAEYLKNGDK